MEKHSLHEGQDLVHRDVEKITSAVYELQAVVYH